MDATGNNEPICLTDFADSVSYVVFAQTSEDIVYFGKDEGGNERTQIYQLTISTQGIEPITDDPEFIYRLGGLSRDDSLMAYSSNKRNGTDFDTYVLHLESGIERQTAKLGGMCSSRGFSPLNSYQVISKPVAGFTNVDLFLINLNDRTQPVQITHHNDPAYYGSIAWLSDESGFYVVSNDNSDKMNLRYYDLKSKSFSEIFATDWDIEQASLTRDDKLLAILLNEGGYSRLRILKTDEHMSPLETKGFPEGEIDQVTWSQDGSKLMFNHCAYDSSYNIWIWEPAVQEAIQLTAMPMGVPGDIMVEPRLSYYQSFDSLEIPIFVYMPKGSKQQAMPVLVYIHGGPEGQFRPNYLPLLQYYAYRGYVVVAPNIRGSDGYGKTYLALDDREKRMDSVKDLEWLHKWLVQNPQTDASHAALYGGSYGGYMVLAGLAFQPELWAAGVDIVGIANLVTFLENTSSWRRSIREAEYGYLATDREFLARISPINHVGRIQAPLFIIHGANDPRVPLSEAEQIRDRLAERGITAEMLVYYDEGHGLSKLKNRLDAYPRVADFLDGILRQNV